MNWYTSVPGQTHASLAIGGRLMDRSHAVQRPLLGYTDPANSISDGACKPCPQWLFSDLKHVRTCV